MASFSIVLLNHDARKFCAECHPQLVAWKWRTIIGGNLCLRLNWSSMARCTFTRISGGSTFDRLQVAVSTRAFQGALLVLTVLLVIFTLALGSAMVRGLNIDCGCFGKAFTSTGTTIPLVRNLVLLILAGFIWRDNK